MFSKFFIERPVLSNVIAIITMILGAVALYNLPIAQYPEITPPTVVISTSYPGANPDVVAETVGAPIEQQVNGVERMLYMNSKSASDGSYTLTVTFEVGTNLDTATVLLQNRVNSAMPRLPQEVQRQGVTVKKRSPDILVVVALTSPDGRYDSLFLSNYGTLRVQDEIARVPGVGDLRIFGADEYAMRIWLDPNKLKTLRLSAQDVTSAIAAQNVQVASGLIGQPPAPSGQNFQYTIQTKGRLADEAEFGEIIVKDARGPSDKVVRVKDVARVELGGRSYDLFAQYKGKPAALMPIFLQPGANALDVSTRVLQRMDELAKDFPEGLSWANAFDTTVFVRKAVSDVYWTLIEAAVLVLVVIMLFLQDWRAMLVPATTVPVTILGSFIAMAWLGFSVNMITLFAVILAIGIVVDDAIIVVEGAAHQMEMGLNSHDAAIRAMQILFGPIIGITLVLVSVFMPAAFLPGITGQIYRQFALVIAATAVISAINAATLKPTQCALWLKMPSKKKNFFFRGFNRVYGWTESSYAWFVNKLIHHAALSMIGYALLIVITVWGFLSLPKSFLPEEDQGYAIIVVQLPGASSQARTREVIEQINGILSNAEGLQGWVGFGGLSILDFVNQSNAATVFVQYKPWDEREKQGLTQQALVGNIQRQLFGLKDAMAIMLVPPAIRGVGSAGGFEMVLEDRGNGGAKALETAVQQMMMAATPQLGIARVTGTYNASTPQLFVDVNRTQAMSYGVRLPEVFSTLQTYLGSVYVNDFNKFGKVFQVRVQADAPYRLKAEDIKTLEVRNAQGNMVPLGSLVDVRDISGPTIVTRYNLFRAASLYGSALPGISSGQALGIMEQLAARTLPSTMGYEWTGLSYQEKLVGNQAYIIFGMAVLLVYLVLAAQYESWFVPGSVILVTPLALLGTMIALKLRGLDNNMYTQVGIVLLIALSCKNAILIVEYARELHAQGTDLYESALQAARLRFRPIIMTSFAFIMGVTPLLTASGVGAASQKAIGTAVFGGMIASTLVSVLIVPVFFVLIQKFVERVFKPKKKGSSAFDASGGPTGQL